MADLLLFSIFLKTLMSPLHVHNKKNQALIVYAIE